MQGRSDSGGTPTRTMTPDVASVVPVYDTDEGASAQSSVVMCVSLCNPLPLSGLDSAVVTLRL